MSISQSIKTLWFLYLSGVQVSEKMIPYRMETMVGGAGIGTHLNHFNRVCLSTPSYQYFSKSTCITVLELLKVLLNVVNEKIVTIYLSSLIPYFGTLGPKYSFTVVFDTFALICE